MSAHQQLKDIIKAMARDNPVLSHGLELAALERSWEEIVGKELAQKCWPERLRDQVLWLSTDNPSWTQQLRFYEKDILSKINGFFKRQTIYALRYEPTKNKREVLSAPSRAAEISAEELALAAADLGDVLPQGGLRAALARIVSKARQFLKRNSAGSPVCKICGESYQGTHPKICLRCEELIRDKKRGQIERLLREAPWVKYEGAKADLPGISQWLFDDVKDLVRRKQADVLRRETFNYLARPTARSRAELKKLIVQYVAIRSGLTPDRINAKIIEQTIGMRRSKQLRLKGVVF